ncbi:MAG: hypothetical protein PVG39_25030 [Desulfobacteraceae bacterium]|jgi:hypothetical protein
MERHQLKPGMPVRIKYFDKKPGHWASEMMSFMGDVVTIRYTGADSAGTVHVKVNENTWNWYSSDFEPMNTDGDPNLLFRHLEAEGQLPEY